MCSTDFAYPPVSQPQSCLQRSLLLHLQPPIFTHPLVVIKSFSKSILSPPVTYLYQLDSMPSSIPSESVR